MTWMMEDTTRVLDYLSCDEEDEITGARCSLMAPHDPPHRDESDWGVILHFREGHLPKLVVPGPGTILPDLGGFEPIS